LSHKPKRIDRRKFIYLGLGAIIVIVGGVATYFAAKLPYVIKETVIRTVERTISATPITIVQTVTGTPTTVKKTIIKTMPGTPTTIVKTLTSTVEKTIVKTSTVTVRHEGEVSQPITEIREPHEEVSIQFFKSDYRKVSLKPKGWFETGQEADILLSGVDFNNTGGPLLFNHPKGIATDGKRLLLADTYNNRILIWNKLPIRNEEPDLVLGQKNFITNNPGKGLDQLNWPVSVATDSKHVLVADTENDRILIWKEFPKRNGQKADIVLQGSEELGIDTRGNILWPWAVWTDGRKLIVTSTMARQVLIWKEFPKRDNQPPDIILKLPEFGTPRSIGSDGKRLIVGDHNAFGNRMGTFVWKSFPTRDDQRYDFLILDPESIGKEPEERGVQHGQVLWSGFTEDGKFVAFGIQIYIWNRFPENENVPPDFIIGVRSPVEKGYRYEGGDGSGIAIAKDKIYLTLSNANKVVGFYSLPTKRDQEPDFAIGAPDIYTNTLETEFFITNPMPLTDGKHLFVFSDYDKKLYIWKGLPDESSAKPDLVYTLPEPVWDGVVRENLLVLTGGPTVFLWNELPLSGEKPKIIRSFGSMRFKGLGGVAIDDKYFYLSDMVENKIYIWEGIPKKDSEPRFIVKVDRAGRLSSDGRYLIVTDTFNHQIKVFEIEKLERSPTNYKPAIINRIGRAEERFNRFNLPQNAIVFQGSLFIADTCFNRVIVWRNIEDAIKGKENYVILGEDSLADIQPEIGRNKLFWPSGLAFDGSFLWIGEFKFSGRLLRFSVR
jgi:hypothetical protein